MRVIYLLIPLVNCFIFNSFNLNIDIIDVQNKINNLIKTQQMEVMHNSIFENVPHDVKLFLFKHLTNDLPDLHKQGDILLELNDNFINILMNSNIDIHLKKEIISKIIDFTLWGDQFGSNILHVYKVLIDNITF